MTNGADRWCPNCRQMVRPKIDVSTGVKTLAVLLYGLAVAYAWSIDRWLEGIIWGAVAALVIAGMIGATNLIRSCPICKTTSLYEQAPIA